MRVNELRCEPYANGEGWWHVPGCEHVDWGEDTEFFREDPWWKKS